MPLGLSLAPNLSSGVKCTMISIDYTIPKQLIADGCGLDLRVFAMCQLVSNDYSIAERRDDIACFDIMLKTADGFSFVWEFEDFGYELSEAITADIEKALGIVSDYVGP